MSINRSIALAICVLLAIPARAEDAPQPLPAIGDVIYKGLVGKALDAVPMDPNERIVLQRTSAVVSSTLTGRSLTAWVGLTNPILLVAGLIWGLFSASNIKAAETNAKPDTRRVEPRDPIEAGAQQFALMAGPPLDEAAEGTRRLENGFGWRVPFAAINGQTSPFTSALHTAVR